MLEFTAYVVIREPELGRSNGPTHIHSTKVAAEEEAIRLATVNRGVVFYVASLVGRAFLEQPKAILFELHEPEDDIPF